MSELVQTLKLQMRAAKLPKPVEEYRFAPPRRWKFDLAWPDKMLAVEVEGGVWMKKARHTTGTGFEGDCRKYGEATVLGWSVIRVTSGMIQSGEALSLVERACVGKKGLR